MLTWMPSSSQIVEIATPSTKCLRIARTFSSPSKCRRVALPSVPIDNPPHPVSPYYATDLGDCPFPREAAQPRGTPKVFVHASHLPCATCLRSGSTPC